MKRRSFVTALLCIIGLRKAEPAKPSDWREIPSDYDKDAKLTRWSVDFHYNFDITSGARGKGYGGSTIVSGSGEMPPELIDALLKMKRRYCWKCGKEEQD